MRSDRPFLSLIIPAYNEARRIEATLSATHEFLHARGYSHELLVGADGTDGTRDLVEALATTHPWLSVFGSAERGGKGKAVREGVSRAAGDVIGFLDADYKTPIEELPKLLRWLDEGYDLVIGSRATSGAAIEVPQAWYRRLGSRAFSAWMHAIVGLRDIPDTQCGFKVFRADVARDLFRRQRIDGYIFDVEILYLARRQGYRIQQVGVRWRDDGDSRLDLITGNLQNFLDVLRIRLGPAQEGRPGEEMLASARPPSRFGRHPGDSGSGSKWP